MRKYYILIIFVFVVSTTIVVTAEDDGSSPPASDESQAKSTHRPNFRLILAQLRFHEFATVAHSLMSTVTSPITIFAAPDSSIHTCTSCSVPLLVREHAVHGLYLLGDLRKLAHGTKLETLATGQCVTINSYNIGDTITFVGRVEITSPDLYNDGFVVIHGLRGLISHLSPCDYYMEESSCSLPTSSKEPLLFLLSVMLEDTTSRLRTNDHSLTASAMLARYDDLLQLSNMTVFVLDDADLSSVENVYLREFTFYVVPNMRLMAADLERMPLLTILPTLKQDHLVVTTAGGGGPMAPMRINHVTIKSPDLMHNLKIVVHGLSRPFPHILHHGRTDSACAAGGHARFTGLSIESLMRIEDHHSHCDLINPNVCRSMYF